MKKTALLFLLSFLTLPVAAQEEPRTSTSSTDFMAGLGKEQTNLSLSYQYAWKFGKKQRLELGVGARMNGFFADNKYYVTAPAKLVKGESGPAALFNKSIPGNMDSVYLPSTQVYAINILVSVGYKVVEKIRVGFNIDVIGFSFGGTQSGAYINGSTAVPVTASPSTFNLLLIGENDLGSLNSEFFIAYAFDSHWSGKLGVQHIFMEYTTSSAVQQFPEPNDRFRITPTVACLGVAYKFH